jgi:hypothetical protein
MGQGVPLWSPGYASQGGPLQGTVIAFSVSVGIKQTASIFFVSLQVLIAVIAQIMALHRVVQSRFRRFGETRCLHLKHD